MNRSTPSNDAFRPRPAVERGDVGSIPPRGRVSRRTASFLALLLAASAFLGGCVYLRLVRVKHQLAEAEKTVLLETREGLQLSFLEPILLPEDILHVANRKPSRVENDRDPARWTYHFRKQPRTRAPCGGGFDVPVELLFTRGRLSGGRLPERFGRTLAPRFVLETLRAVGRSRVEIAPRTVCGRVPPERMKGAGAFLPTPQCVTALSVPPIKGTGETACGWCTGTRWSAEAAPTAGGPAGPRWPSSSAAATAGWSAWRPASAEPASTWISRRKGPRRTRPDEEGLPGVPFFFLDLGLTLWKMPEDAREKRCTCTREAPFLVTTSDRPPGL